MAESRSLVYRYYAFRATVAVGFISPIFTLFVLRDLSFAQFGTLSALYSVLSVVGEVPTGVVGDRFGRRASLTLSVVFSILSLAGFVFAQSFLWYTILFGFWALALTFRSGSMDAWLYDVLDERLDAGDFSHVRGRGDAVQAWSNVVTMVAGGLLYGLDPTYPFVAAVGVNGLALGVLVSLPKNVQYRAGTSGGDDASADADRIGPLDALGLIRDELGRPPLRSLVVYFGLFYAVVGTATAYVQPMAVETVGPLAASLGVELPAAGAVAAARSGQVGPTLALGLGVLYAALSAVASVGGYYAGPIEARYGTRLTLLVVPLVTAVFMVLPLGVALLALPAFATMRAGVPLAQPVANGYLNDHLGSAGRATTLSAASMLYMGFRTPLAVAAGVVAGWTTATTSVAALGGFLLVVAGAVWLVGEVAPPRTTAGAAEP
ncbi:MFS transporter [Halobacteriales archaeon Cl-PHB]